MSDWTSYSYQPKTKKELKEIIKKRIFKEGPDCNLNDVDTSLITDMSWLFYVSEFNGDISNWDVSNVNDMNCMFERSSFNGDISKWNVSNVDDMSDMFAYSGFSQDISNWNINKNCNVESMFYECPIKDEYKPVLPK